MTARDLAEQMALLADLIGQPRNLPCPSSSPKPASGSKPEREKNMPTEPEPPTWSRGTSLYRLWVDPDTGLYCRAYRDAKWLKWRVYATDAVANPHRYPRHGGMES